MSHHELLFGGFGGASWQDRHAGRELSRLDDSELLDQGEERASERRGAGARANELPIELLPQRSSELEDGLEVRLLLGQREQLRDEDVVDRRDEECLRTHFHLRRARKLLVSDRPACRTEDEIDEHRAVVGLEQPLLRRTLGVHACVLERQEGAFGVFLPEVEVHVVIRGWPSECPRGKTASEHELDVRITQRGRRALHRRDERMLVLSGLRRHRSGSSYPVSAFAERSLRVSPPL